MDMASSFSRGMGAIPTQALQASFMWNETGRLRVPGVFEAGKCPRSAVSREVSVIEVYAFATPNSVRMR